MIHACSLLSLCQIDIIQIDDFASLNANNQWPLDEDMSGQSNILPILFLDMPLKGQITSTSSTFPSTLTDKFHVLFKAKTEEQLLEMFSWLVLPFILSLKQIT